MSTPSTLYPLPSTLRARRGFTLYYAVLIGSVLLLIGASLLNLSLKEFLLSAAVRESEYAFFAADSGIECALRWDLKELFNNQPIFQIYNNTGGASAPLYVFYVPASNKDEVECNCASPIAISVTASSLSGATTDFSYNVGASGQSQYCVRVQVIKEIKEEPLSSGNYEVWTTINSRGYNFACSDTSVNTRKVERALTTLYPRAF